MFLDTSKLYNGILPEDLISICEDLRQDWINYLSFLDGIDLDTKIKLTDNLIIKFKGNYISDKGTEYSYTDIDNNTYKLKLNGTDPYIIFHNNKFIELYSISYDNYPSGTILPFIINIPDGWTKLDMSAYIKVSDDVNMSINKSTQMSFTINDKLTGFMNVRTTSTSDKDYIPDADGSANSNGIQSYDRLSGVSHTHNLNITSSNNNLNPNPKHKEIIYAYKN